MANERRGKVVKSPLPTPEPETGSSRSSPLVFISHDTRDADLAEAFGNLLTDASGGILQSFRSSDRKGTSGIEFGAEWYQSIMKKLDDATDVVALLTKHSINRPWILYESGVAKGKLDTTVLGIALGIKLEEATTGPFAQFQNCGDDSESLTKLVLQLIKKNPNASPREEAVKRQVHAFTEIVKEIFNARGTTPESNPSEDTSVAKMFEEVKVLVRDLPDRMNNHLQDLGISRRIKKRKKFHPFMLQEFISETKMFDKTNAGSLGILMFASMFKDEIPWFYELAINLQRAYQTGDDQQIREAKRYIFASTEIMQNSRFMFDFFDKETESIILMLRHDLDFLDEGLFRNQRPAPKKSIKDDQPDT